MPATVQEIETLLVDIPTIRPHKLSMTTMGCQTMMILRLTDSDGLVGIGEATTIGGLSYGPQSPEGIKSAIDHYLGPLLKGQNCDDINGICLRLNSAVKGNSFAKSAIETALWDLKGKRLNQPLHALWGGAVNSHLPVLWTLASGDTARDIDEAKSLISAGRHNCFKLKIGARSLTADVSHVAAIKAALGDDISVRVDVNQAWDASTAAKGMQMLQDAGIDLVEQPTPAKERAALAQLCSRFVIPILADEAIEDSLDAFSLAAAGFCGAFALKIAKAGGPQQALKVAAVARSAGIGLYGGTMLEGSIGTAAALHAWATLGPLQWGTEMFGPLLMKDDIVTEPLRYHNFGVSLPTGPGLGIELDQDKLAFYRRND
ncbi:muconate/chloromuconate family cycloisomerase [Gallaecimonas mangrovi]|uniref:muconate/chloromuconate family cycloisomerase n=1 Tax=Gallaecimonas mangrovi TaxID=2291597 RepID=UPI000E1FC9F5|nr:muconate/chloromuconate family cycloisomerase [Gallaecimonas mangrovi]